MAQIKTSLYEHLHPLTTVMKQHFVENFSGDALDTDRWASHSSGSFNGAMADAVDEGFSMTTQGTSAGHYNKIDFHTSNTVLKRQFNHQGLVGIAVMRMVTTANNFGAITFSMFDDWYTEDGSYIQAVANNYNSTIKHSVRNGSPLTTTSVTSSTTSTKTWHSYKLETNSTTSSFTLDGVLDGVISQIPNEALCPVLTVANAEGTGAQEGRFRYIEAYNT